MSNKSIPQSMIKTFVFIIVSISILAIIGILILNSKPKDSSETSINNNRIISLIPSITQSIYYLEANDKLIGCSNYCQVKTEDSLMIVGSVTKPNIEKIISLKPDILILSQLVSPKEVETLRKFGIRVEIIPAPKSFNEICEQFIFLGGLVGKENKAKEIIDKAKKEVYDIEQASKERHGEQKIFMQIGADPIYTVYPGTYMNDYITLSENKNIASELNKGTVGREFVVSNNPDYIFVVTMGIIGEEEVKKWKQFSQLTAVKNNNIYILDSNIACQPTPITFVETLKEINKIISQH